MKRLKSIRQTGPQMKGPERAAPGAAEELYRKIFDHSNDAIFVMEAGIIILTTYDTDDYIFRGIEAGARGYLLKDSPPEEVLKAVRAVYRGESLIQPRVASRLLDRLSQPSRIAAPPEGSLSAREVEVLQIMATGAANKEIASRLNIGQSTVKTHIVRIFDKLGVSDRTEAVTEAAKRKIIDL